MSDKDGLEMVGTLITRERDPVTHELVRELIDHNILTYYSRNAICKWLADDTPPSAGAWSYMAIGYGTTAAAAGQTALVSELTRESAVLSVETDTGTSEDIIFQATNTFSANTGDANYQTVWEFALFDADTAGNMFNRIKGDVARDNYNNDLEVIYQCLLSSS